MAKRRETASPATIPLVGVLVALAVLTAWVSGSPSSAATSKPIDVLHAAVRATRDAPSFVITWKQSGYQPPDSGDPGPVTLVYQAPDRFRSAQRLAGTQGVTVTIIQIGRDHYQEDSQQPNVWMHNTLPSSEAGWASFLPTIFDPLLGVTRVSRAGDVYRFKVRSPSAGHALGAAVARVARGYLVSLALQVNLGHGKTRQLKIRFSRFGTAPDVQPPTGTIQEAG